MSEEALRRAGEEGGSQWRDMERAEHATGTCRETEREERNGERVPRPSF